MPAALSQSDIDAIYYAIRPRLKKLLSGGTTTVTTVGPHTHSAVDIGFDPAGRIASGECQSSQEELDDEKLARDGTQTMLGDLDMNAHAVNNILNLNMSGGVGNAILKLVRTITMTGVGLIQNVRTLNFGGSAVGEGLINAPRVVHMDGDDDDGEGLIDGLERIVFNDEPTKSVIDNPSRVEWNTTVTPGTHYTNAVGLSSWSTVEGTSVVIVAAGS
jgi:hypothetical protein